MGVSSALAVIPCHLSSVAQKEQTNIGVKIAFLVTILEVEPMVVQIILFVTSQSYVQNALK